MPDINDFLKNINTKDLKEAVKKAQEYSKTAEGKALIEKMKNGGGGEFDKNDIMSAIDKNPDFIKRLKDLL